IYRLHLVAKLVVDRTEIVVGVFVCVIELRCLLVVAFGRRQVAGELCFESLGNESRRLLCWGSLASASATGCGNQQCRRYERARANEPLREMQHAAQYTVGR